MAFKHRKIRVVFGLAAVAVVGVAVFSARDFYHGAATISELLGENKQLKQALTNLTTEDQIGYAKVISQRTDENGRVLTTLRFVETSRDDKTKTILQKEYTIEGDIVHFDALIVTFSDQMVIDGKSRALYLWRRVYGESMAPDSGYTIEEPNSEPKRYSGLFESLPLEDRRLFWSGIWDLANDPEALQQHGIKAIYGSVIYHKLREGLIYVFKISPSGQLYPEVVPDM
jgi:hypothetical protein